ncbi:hypothetical protein GW17_00014334 [Ensete ventricosum]|nr:hypothetical protein GW17_00014334 [Ensete ventricosum]
MSDESYASRAPCGSRRRSNRDEGSQPIASCHIITWIRTLTVLILPLRRFPGPAPAMKRSKSVESLHGRRRRLSHLLLVAAALYLFFIALKFRHFLEVAYVVSDDGSVAGGLDRPLDGVADVGRNLFGSAYHGGAHQRKLEDGRTPDAPRVPHGKVPLVLRARQSGSFDEGYGRITGEIMKRYLRGGGRQRRGNFSVLEGMAQEAWALGLKAWEELENYRSGTELIPATVVRIKPESCPSAITGPETVAESERVMFLPCGLAVGSSITVVGTPQDAHQEHVPQLARLRQGNETVMVSQFVLELQGLKSVDSEDPPKILHLNPRLKGDWSQVPIIEHNTCYRMQWSKALRCDGVPSKEDEETGKILVPFLGFTLEDATGLTIKGDVDIHSVYATSLPTSHPSFSAQHVPEMSERWKSPPLPQNPVQIFIGIISATSHFAERMAVRKTWMQYPALHSSSAIARFFVALEWPEEIYPPYADGPGYIISNDIARYVLFKMEDVSMGMWVEEFNTTTTTTTTIQYSHSWKYRRTPYTKR